MAELIKRIVEWSKSNDAVVERDWYSTWLVVLAFSGLGLKIPFVLNVIVQGCLVVCTLDVAYRYLRMKKYSMCIIKLLPLILVGLFDPIMLTF